MMTPANPADLLTLTETMRGYGSQFRVGDLGGVEVSVAAGTGPELL